ncbi:MAG: hypothetical protein LBF74_00535 [Treponema sp.]|jgi:hypothetical protein|nr:hypothetical protein [Treponema sp.]
MKPPRGIFFLLLSLLVFGSGPLFARDVEVTVEDAELEMPLEGAAILLRNGEEYVCDEAGKALFTLPDDGPAVIRIVYPGYESRRLTIPAAEAGGDGIQRITAALRLGGVMESRELVLEAERPGTSETKSGRSVAISDRELARTAEIGIIEDVMTSVKLLPGVGYSGMFNALPSIRGGDPGDLMAVLDGFYLERPYHWGGGFSIFDPKMVSSARLSHGVFSSRYGHTISGLLEISSKTPSPTETELEAAIGSSAASLNLSFPLAGKGGILFMGKVTYWDTLVWAAKGLSRAMPDNETLDLVNSVSTAPFIRSAAISANYRFTGNLEMKANAFFGSDGVGAAYRNVYDDEDIQGKVNMDFEFGNYQGFLITGLTFNPLPSMVLKATAGGGFIQTSADGFVDNRVTIRYNQEFLDKYEDTLTGLKSDQSYTAPNANGELDTNMTIANFQGRADLDWDLGRGFLAAAGAQELYSLWNQREDIDTILETPIAELPQATIDLLPEHLFPIKDIPNAALIRPIGYTGDVRNQGFTTSGYGLVEYASPDRKFGAELGIRVDHLYFLGRDFSVQTRPALNPRLNLDFGVLKNRGAVDSLTFTAGTGLFSSMNETVSFIEKSSGIEDYGLKMNRSWTSLIGTKIDFERGYSFSLEGYYKRVFDRAYLTVDMTSSNTIVPAFAFDGIGNVWGFDLQLQKLESRYWDGWISYSFNWAKYRNPQSEEDRWYYPSFHRFHNFNLVLAIKPIRRFNIAVRLGLASGRPASKTGDEIYSYPVQEVDENNQPVLDENGKPVIIQKYRRDSWYDENERSAWSVPLDVKFSFFRFDHKGRVLSEIYLGAENLLAPIFAAQGGGTTFNEYTGRVDTGANSASYGLPIPMVSLGFKWSY